MSYSLDDLSNCWTPFYQHTTFCTNTTRREILVPDTTEKASEKAAEIFGQNYIALSVRTEMGKKYIDLQRNGGMAGFAGCGLIAIVLSVLTCSGTIPACIGGCCTGCSGCMAGTVYGLSCNSKFDPTYQTADILKMCDLIAQFSVAFASFKNDPQEEKIKSLFIEFDKFNELLSSRNCPSIRWTWEEHQDRFKGIDLTLFRSTGRLFLMDAIAEVLRSKDQEGEIPLQWDRMLSSPITSHYVEPWYSLGIPNPSPYDYQLYGYLRDRIDSLELVDKMIEIFQTALNNEFRINFGPLQDEI